MKHNEVKNFIFDSKAAVKIGTVQMYESELIHNVFEEKKPYILARRCAYFISGKSTQLDENGRTTYYYTKLTTRSQRNVKWGRYFAMTEEEIKKHLA